MLVLGPFGERLVLVWLVPLIRLVQVDLGVCFALIVLLSSLTDFIQKSRHFFHLDVALISLAQLVYGTGWFLA